MNQIVADVIDFVNKPESTPPTLKPAIESLTFQAVRVVCIKLAGWWRREHLSSSRHPYLTLKQNCEWRKDLETMIATTPLLSQLAHMTSDRFRFADDLTQAEIAEINSYARANYRPPLLT